MSVVLFLHCLIKVVLACRMDDLFSISMHHGGYFTKNAKTYVGGEVDVVDNCDLDKWSKVEIEGICRDFGTNLLAGCGIQCLVWTKKGQTSIWLLMIMMPCT